MFVIVAYDVACTRRRNKVAKILLNYGERVNFSVFECELKKPESFKKLQQEIQKAIHKRDDHIRYYVLCERCRRRISVQGAGREQTFDREIVRFV